MLVEGEWTAESRREDEEGRFIRPSSAFRHFVTADGSSGYKAEPGRYHLYISWACPWAHRTAIMRKLKGLEWAVSMSVLDPIMGEESWEGRPRLYGSGLHPCFLGQERVHHRQ